MKIKKVLSILLISTMALTTVLTGCSNDKTTDAEKKPTEDIAEAKKPSENVPQELVIATKSDVLTMDPIFSTTIPDQRGQAPVYEGLTKRVGNDEGGVDLMPGAAESWTISDDQLVYTFNLRKEAKWSDGTPVTANDFVYSWQRIFDPAVACPQSWQLEGIIKNSLPIIKGEMAVDKLGVKAVDDYTFEVTLEAPFDDMLLYSGFNFARPVKKEQIDLYGSKYGSTIDKIVGNGPYIVKAWEPNAKIIYEPNPYYWNKENVHLTKITRPVIIEPNAVAQSLIANEVDIAELDSPDWNTLVDNTGLYDTFAMPNMDMEFFIFNCKDPVLKNPKIRLAIALAYDRTRFNTEVCEEKNVPAYSISPSISMVGETSYLEMTSGRNEFIKKMQGELDPKAILLEGMKELNLGDDPSTITVNYATRGVSEFCKKSGEWLKQEIESTLGINFLINLTEWNIMYDMIDAGDYQIAQCGWSVDTSLEPINFLEIFHTTKGYYNGEKMSWVGEKAKEYDKLVEEAKAEKDPKKRTELYLAAEEILLNECPVSPTYSTKVRTLVGKYVDGYYAHPFIFHDFVGVSMNAK